MDKQHPDHVRDASARFLGWLYGRIAEGLTPTEDEAVRWLEAYQPLKDDEERAACSNLAREESNLRYAEFIKKWEQAGCNEPRDFFSAGFVAAETYDTIRWFLFGITDFFSERHHDRLMADLDAKNDRSMRRYRIRIFLHRFLPMAVFA